MWGTENHNSRKKFGKDRNTGFRNDEITKPKLRVIGHDSQYHKNFLTSSYYVFIYNGVIVIDLSGVQLGLKSQVWKKEMYFMIAPLFMSFWTGTIWSPYM